MAKKSTEKKVFEKEKDLEVKEIKIEKKIEDEKIIEQPKKKEKKEIIGTVNVPLLNVRLGAGFNFSNFLPCPTIRKDSKVKVLEEVLDKNNEKWYKVNLMSPEMEQQVYVKANFINI